MRNLDQWAPLLAAILAAMAALLTAVIIFHFEGERERKYKRLEHRREAIFEALLVIDKVYANSHFDHKKPPHPEDWKLQLARTASNKLLLYADNPKVIVTAFNDAIGLHNPTFEFAPIYNPALLNKFRLQAAKELEIPSDRFFDNDKAWIYELPGGK